MQIREVCAFDSLVKYLNLINLALSPKPLIIESAFARQHFRNSSGHTIRQIPVGCGKTGLMALLPFKVAQGWFC